jgi:beta-glucosidase
MIRSDELISRVAAANPNTVVVLQTGSAVSMPWLSAVKGVVHAFYLGNECGDAIASILYGTANPSARLSLTLPKREEDVPAFPDFKSARTKVHYSEGIWVGYKHYNMRKIQPLFPFGHGLSYTTFEYSDLTISAPAATATKVADEWKCVVEVTVTNTGLKKGHHSVHIYLTPPAETDVSLKHAEHSLQAFDKVYDIAPGESRRIKLELDKCKLSLRLLCPVLGLTEQMQFRIGMT